MPDDSVHEDDSERDTLGVQSSLAPKWIAETMAPMSEYYAKHMGDHLSSESQGRLQVLLTRLVEQPNDEQKADLAQAFQEVVSRLEKIHAIKLREHRVFRLLVKRFSHHFAGADKAAPRLSRRLLPGLFSSIRTMQPKQSLAGVEAAVDDRLIALREEQGILAAWDALYEDREAQRLVNSMLLEWLPYFENLDKRKRWLTEVVLGQVGPERDECRDVEVFGDSAFMFMMQGLYGQLLELPAWLSANQRAALRKLKAELQALSN